MIMKKENNQENLKTVLEELNQYEAELIHQNEELQQKNMELELLKSEYYQLFEFSPVCYVIVDDKLNILKMNYAFSRLLNISKQKLLTKFFTKYVPAKDHKILINYIYQIYSNQHPDPIEIKIQPYNNNTLQVQIKSIKIKDKAGIDRVLCSMIDITKLYSAIYSEKKLKYEYENIIDNMNDGFALHRIIYDDDDNPIDYEFLKINKSFLKILNLDSDIINKKMSDLVGTKEALYWAKIYYDILDKNIHLFFQSYSFKFNKEFEIFAFKTKSDHFVTIFRDITSQTEFQRLLTVAKDKAEELVKIKQEFVSNMGHEIRTPLSGIYGMFQLLKSTNLNDDQTKFVELGIQTCSKLTLLLGDILEISQIDSGNVIIKDDIIDICELFDDLKNLYNIEILNKNININLIISDKFKTCIVSDRIRLNQILYNIIGNSIKYTQAGSIDITVDLINQYFYRSRLFIKIKDTGIGIPDDKMKFIFDPFRQGDSSLTKKFDGVGLGLYIVKKIIELLNGSVSIESEENVGTTVYISIPIQLQDCNDVCKNQKLRTVENILLVEDDRVTQFFMLTFLNEYYNVICADNGQMALDLLENHKIDLIIMDAQMPILNGIDATRIIRQNPKYKDIYIIGISAFCDDNNKSEFINSGMNEYMHKPINIQHLKNIIEKIKI